MTIGEPEAGVEPITEGPERGVEGEPKREVELSNVMEHDTISNTTKDRIVIAIDFGTTFSSVAYTVLKKGVSPEDVGVHSVQCIGDYTAPRAYTDVRQDVPTELWYDYGNTNETTEDFEVSESDSEDEHSAELWPQRSTNPERHDSERSNLETKEALNSNLLKKANKTRLVPSTQYWGFGVQQKLDTMNIPKNQAGSLTRFKLNLDQKEETKSVRAEVQTILNNLVKSKVIKNETDIYAHYLTHLLKHTKSELLQDSEFHDNMFVQFVLCVPAKWPVHACRIMQIALEEAIVQAELTGKNEQSECNIFMISEPEAAAECILAESSSYIYPDESIIVLDAGGVPVDVVSYMCDKKEPLRLSEEIVAPDKLGLSEASKLCGSSYINERFEKALLDKLKSEEHYLVRNGKTLKSTVQAATANFENGRKRRIDTADDTTPPISVTIDNLRQNPAKRFSQNHLHLSLKRIRKCFGASLAGTRHMLQSQLALARSQGHEVYKVILTGGFGQSPALKSSIRQCLKEEEANYNEIELIVPENPSITVARGAVLRALNKKFGPTRKSQCSYGFVISEVHQPDVFEAHRYTTYRIGPIDGEKYIHGTIRWMVQAGKKLENMAPHTTGVKQTFEISEEKLECSEQLWMSDRKHPDHYRKTHPQNKGAVQVGAIKADLTFLKLEGLIQPTMPLAENNRSGTLEPYWEVDYELAMIPEGRSMRFEARWPIKSNLKPGQTQNVIAAKLIGIAAAFEPGTA